MASLRIVDRLDPSERARVEELLARVAEQDAHPALPDAKLAELRAASGPTGFAVLATDGRGDTDGSAAKDSAAKGSAAKGSAATDSAAEHVEGDLVGYAHALRPDDAGTWYVQTAVAPDARAVPGVPGDDLEAELARVALGEARDRGAAALRWWVFRAGDADNGRAAQLGLTMVREVVQMRRPLPHPDAPAFPDDVTLRPFEPGHDEDAWLEVNRRAFRDHPEQGGYTLEDLKARMAETWFDPTGFLLAEDAAGLCGFCWTKVPGDGTGEIYAIASDPRRRGEGLGRALVLAGLDHIASTGATVGTLYVEGDNRPAIALYEALGFDVDHADRVYGDVP